MSNRVRQVVFGWVVLLAPAAVGAQDAPPEGDPPPPPPPMCVTVTGSCGEGGLCEGGGDCIGQFCVLVGDPCKDSSECGDFGQCYAVAGPCEFQENCSDGFACQLNMCVMLLPPPPPDGMGSCNPEFERCPPPDGEPPPPPPCDSDDECAGGTCSDGICQLFGMEPPCEGDDCVMADGDGQPSDGDGDAMTGGDGKSPVGEEGVDDAEEAADDAEQKASALTCSVQNGRGSLGLYGFGFLMLVSARALRRRR
jgi:hypothetical protein